MESYMENYLSYHNYIFIVLLYISINFHGTIFQNKVCFQNAALDESCL